VQAEEIRYIDREGRLFVTKLVQQAIAAISQLPPETQDDIARLMLALAEGAPIPLTSDEAEAIAEAEAEIARGDRVPAETIRAFWRTHGL
jgi:hypothetical protein